MKVTLKQIQAFLAVADNKSFSVAAERVHLSQPALSASIGRLEVTLGARLFNRDTRSVELSILGGEFLLVARGIMESVDAGMSRMREIINGKYGSLSIAVAPTVAAGFLPKMLTSFIEKHPQIELKIFDVMSDQCIEMLRSGAADVALMPARNDILDVSQHELFKDPLVVVCAQNEPLANKSEIHWQDIISSKIIVRSTASSVRQHLEAEYLRRGVVLKPAFEVHHASTAVALISAGLGIGVMPKSLLDSLNMKGLTTRNITDPSADYWSICICKVISRSPAPAAKLFIESCYQNIPRLSFDNSENDAA